MFLRSKKVVGKAFFFKERFILTFALCTIHFSMSGQNSTEFCADALPSY
jgi:hypothetical protein